MYIIGKRLTLQGFIVTDFEDLKPQFYQEMTAWLNAGEINAQQTILDGIENAPQAFLNLFGGTNLGKMLVKL